MRPDPCGPMTAYRLKTHRGVRGFCATETPKSHSLRPEGISPACYFGTHYSCRSVADLRLIQKPEKPKRNSVTVTGLDVADGKVAVGNVFYLFKGLASASNLKQILVVD